MNKHLFLILFFLFILPIVFAQLQLPPNLEKLQEQNKVIAHQAFEKITFGIAFLAGMLTFLSPCVLPILMVFIASSLQAETGKSRRFLFFMLGMSSALTVMGFIIGYLGKISLDFFPYRSLLAQLAGVFFLVLGGTLLAGKSFGSFSLSHKPVSAYATGFLFAFGWTACTGPVLAGVLAIGALLQNVFYAALLLFVYSLGIGFPFLLAALVYPHLGGALWKGKEITIGSYAVHASSFLSGLLYIVLGSILLFFQGTALFNSINFGGTDYYYLFQDRLLEGITYLPYVGGFFLSLFVLFISRVIRKGDAQ